MKSLLFTSPAIRYVTALLLINLVLHTTYASPLIVPDLGRSHVTDCGTANGAAWIASILENSTPQEISKYNYSWFLEDKITTISTTDTAITEIESGNYWVLAYNPITGDSSEYRSFYIDNISSAPYVMAQEIIPDNACEGMDPIGMITIDIDGGSDPAEYIINWFEEDSVSILGSITSTAVIDATGLTVSKLPAGKYVVNVTDTVSPGKDCNYVRSFEVVGDDLEVEISDIIVGFENACEGIKGAGVVNQILENGVPASPCGSCYEYEWFDADTSTIAGPDVANMLLDLSHGEYLVQARNVNTNCYSDPRKFTVEIIALSTPDISPTIMPSVSCVTTQGDGSILLEIDYGADPDDYTIEWYEENGTDPLGVSSMGVSINADSSEVTNLPVGTYVVEVTSLPECTTKQELTVALQDPNLDIVLNGVTVKHEDNCHAPNGSLTLNSFEVNGNPGNPDDYIFHWFEGAVYYYDSSLAAHKGLVFDSLESGPYTLSAMHKQTGCESEPLILIVEDLIAYPVAEIGAVDNTSCTGTPNGILSAEVPDDASNYSFEWYAGTELIEENLIEDTTVLAQVDQGTYSLLLTRLSTECTNTYERSLTHTMIAPLLAAEVLNDQYNCDTANYTGILKADVGDTTNGYSFYWFEGHIDTPDTSAVDFTGPDHSGMPSGDFTVMAMDDYTGCSSQVEQVTILNKSAAPEITVTVENNSACMPTHSNGYLSITVEEADASEYEYAWYAVVAGENNQLLSEEESVSGLASGAYLGVVRDVPTGCLSISDVTIDDDFAIPVPLAQVDNPQTSCIKGNPNGRFKGVVDGQSEGFRFFWFNGYVANPDTAQADAVNLVFADLPVGDYTLLAFDLSTQCLSEPVVNSIVEQITLPDIEVDVNGEQDEVGLFSFQLYASVLGLTEPEYTFEWFEGVGTSGELLSQWSSLIGMEQGLFTVVATETATGCVNQKELATTIPLPLPPEAFALQVDSYNQIKLQWEDMAEFEDGYVLERKSDFSTGFITVAWLPKNSESFTDSDIMPETTYTYRVASYNAYGKSYAADTLSGTTLIRPPNGAPSFLQAEILDPWTVKITWADYTSNEDGFHVERFNHDTQKYEIISTQLETEYTDAELVPGTEYRYRVAAYNGGGVSSYSNVVSVIPIITALEENMNIEMHIFPNPAVDFLNIQIAETNDYDVVLFNSRGQVLYKGNSMGDKDHSIDLSHINDHLLLLQIRTDDKLFSEKIIKR